MKAGMGAAKRAERTIQRRSCYHHHKVAEKRDTAIKGGPDHTTQEEGAENGTTTDLNTNTATRTLVGNTENTAGLNLNTNLLAVGAKNKFIDPARTVAEAVEANEKSPSPKNP